MLTAEEYGRLTGQEAPDAFNALLPLAEELLHARTLQQYRRDDLPAGPAAAFRRALALQIAYMDSRGGLEGWADPLAASASVTLGRFSIKESAASNSGTEARLIAPGPAVLLPVLMAYARSWMGGELH